MLNQYRDEQRKDFLNCNGRENPVTLHLPLVKLTAAAQSWIIHSIDLSLN